MFISNSDKNLTLATRVKELISQSKELKFLVGFFYFSGIEVLLDSLIKKPNIHLKILVGLNIDSDIQKVVEFGVTPPESRKERERIGYIKKSKEQHIDEYIQSIKKSLNHKNNDTKEFYEQVKFFLKMIQENKLIIRKTLDPNHAKLYIFELENNIVNKGVVITGSSNLTQAGLNTQNEYNVQLLDNHPVEESIKYFDTLWDTSIEITENDVIKQRLFETIQDETQVANITPYEAYMKVLETYIKSKSQQEVSSGIQDVLRANGFTPYQYQLDAVQQALSAIENYNGVIIADVVGLGKSVISSMIIRELGLAKGIIVSPPGLIGEAHTSGWANYKEIFDFKHWDIISSGNVEGFLEKYQSDKLRDKYEYVLVDEAHRFRNENTSQYEALNILCKNRKVILLTATPFNNSPSDFFSMVKLFDIPKQSRISIDGNLEYQFRVFENDFKRISDIRKNYKSPDPLKQQRALQDYQSLIGKKVDKIDIEHLNIRARYLSDQVRSIIEPVLIRRNRKDLEQDPVYQKDIPDMSQVQDPEAQLFELDPEQSEFYDNVIQKYFGREGKFTGAIYRPVVYEAGNYKKSPEKITGLAENFEYQAQNNLFDFMTRHLVKRFESSFGSFYQSIINTLKLYEFVDKVIDETGKYIFARELFDKFQDDEDLDFNEIRKEIERLERESKKDINKVKTKKSVYNLDSKAFLQKNDFINNIKADIELLKHIKSEIEELSLNQVNQDPKAQKLIESIKSSLHKEPNRKTVIFTEFLDTLEYIKPLLEKYFPNRVLVINKGIDNNINQKIQTNFDASVSLSEQANDYDIILGTDRISEGFNLNRAGIVINYDIPWNPTRVIQRVGRINRLSAKVFEKLYIYNYFPTDKGNNILKSKEIATNKMFMIHTILGEDAKIFDIDEQPTPAGLYTRLTTNPEQEESSSFLTKIRKEFFEFQAQYPELYQKITRLPDRIKVAKTGTQDNLYVFLKKGKAFQVRSTNYEPDSTIEDPTIESTIDNIKANPDDKAIELSNNFWQHYPELQKKFINKKTLRTSSQTVQDKALTVLDKYLDNFQIPKNLETIARELREDIISYGTTSAETARKITKVQNIDELIDILTKLKSYLSENYLNNIRQETDKISVDIIIAIENIKNKSIKIIE
jgi:superfamily II DNA or RNA helicase